MKITRSQLKHIIKEEIKHIIKEDNGGWPVSGHYADGEPYEYGSYAQYLGSNVGRPGKPWLTGAGRRIELDRPETEEDRQIAAETGAGSDFEAQLRAAGLSGEETRTDASEGYELPEEEKLKDEEEQGPIQAVFGQAPAVNPPGSYASAGGGVPQWNVTRDLEVVPVEGSGFFGSGGGPPEGYTYDPSTGEFRPQRESQQRKLQRIIEEELGAILSEQGISP